MFKHINSKSAIFQFIVSSGALRVTDPCYSLNTWCAGTIENVKNGTWLSQVGYYNDPFDKECFDNYRKHKRDTLKAASAQSAKEFRERIGEDEFAKVKDNFKTIFDIELDVLEKHWAEQGELPQPRVAYIRVTHEDFKADLESDFDQNFEVSTIDVGVDSGQAGFFDLEKYNKALENKDNQKPGEEDPIFEAFYKGCCDLTLGENSFGAIEFGTVSSSGYGDGGYTLLFRKVDDQIVDAYIVFIGDHEEQDEEEAIEIPVEVGV